LREELKVLQEAEVIGEPENGEYASLRNNPSKCKCAQQRCFHSNGDESIDETWRGCPRAHHRISMELEDSVAGGVQRGAELLNGQRESELTEEETVALRRLRPCVRVIHVWPQ
jgi:hypothetical protein